MGRKAQDKPHGYEPLQVFTLGRFAVQFRGQDVTPPPQRAARLFKFLLSRPSHSAATGVIAQSLWPEHLTASKNVHAAAHDLRTWLRDATLLRSFNHQYSLDVGVDADEFDLRITAARRISAIDWVSANKEFAVAVELYAGTFLPGDEDPWIVARRQRLELHFCNALVFLADVALETDEATRALEFLGRLSEIMPEREDALRMHMRALSALGRRSEALRLFETFRERVETELHSPPDPATTRTRNELLAAHLEGSVSLAKGKIAE